MNLETRLDPRLWEAIQSSYENRHYTGAILDSLYFLSNLIRDKADLESDGVALIGQAFGGNSPKLRITKLQTESDWNIQRGLEQLLRGIYLAIRNPRSHEKYMDSPEDAESMLLFFNYLVKLIDQAKPPFTKNEFLKRVFDPDFVEDKRYSELLVKDIPAKKRLEIFVDIYRKKEEGDGKKLHYFVSELMGCLNEEELSQVYQIVSEELRDTSSTSTIRQILRIFPSTVWERLDQLARHIVENKLIMSIKDGRYDEESEKCDDGAFGTWATSISSKSFLRKSELIEILLGKLWSADKEEQDYVFRFFFCYLIELSDPPPGWIKETIIEELKKGDVRFRNALKGVMASESPKSWHEIFKEHYENFKLAEPPLQKTDDEEDIPF